MNNIEPVERIFISFTLISESLIPDEITSRLGISPDLSFKRGDVGGEYEGKKIERSHGVWEIVSDNRGLPPDDVVAQLKWLVELLEPVKENLRQILEDKTIQATIGFFWIAPNGRINVEFKPELLSQLAALDVKIRFDIYGDYS